MLDRLIRILDQESDEWNEINIMLEDLHEYGIQCDIISNCIRKLKTELKNGVMNPVRVVSGLGLLEAPAQARLIKTLIKELVEVRRINEYDRLDLLNELHKKEKKLLSERRKKRGEKKNQPV